VSGKINTINLTGVNCYLIKSEEGNLLIDTGFVNKREFLEKKLTSLGCLPGNLKLIILTHGDVDHAGNAAFLREKYGSKIAVHADDKAMLERGDMSVNRKAKPDKMSLIFKVVSWTMSLFIKPGKFDVFQPDLTIDENFNLSEYGFDLKIIHLPGHSKGSVGVLTADGDLFCGDFLYNMLGFNMIDNLPDHKASVEKLKKLNIKMIYPGHGKPISNDQFQRKFR
jgi:hydroxyacylglutathione hydrolase